MLVAREYRLQLLGETVRLLPLQIEESSNKALSGRVALERFLRINMVILMTNDAK